MITRTQYLLCKLAEEASEVAQIAMKAQQFGIDDTYKIETNRKRIHNELNDLLAIVELLNEESGLQFWKDPTAILTKRTKVDKYYKYSVELDEVIDANL